MRESHVGKETALMTNASNPTRKTPISQDEESTHKSQAVAGLERRGQAMQVFLRRRGSG